jgi:tRNA wybutosine-synthesizing protein 1
VEHTLGAEMQGEGDEPELIVEEAIKAQRALLSGYGGEKERVTKQEIEEAYSPKHVAISLAGEPTNYPRIAELVEAFHRRGMTTFLVTNGMNPERIAEVRPTSLYLSLIAYNEELYRRINVPRVRQGWERLMHSLEVFSQSRSRKVVRITLVRGYNLEAPEAFAPLIERAEPDFVEAKGYVHVGYSRRRLTREHMPSYEEVGAFAKALAEATGYVIADSSRDSKVFLIKKG